MGIASRDGVPWANIANIDGIDAKGYSPDMVVYTGSNYFYRQNTNETGNEITVVMRFRCGVQSSASFGRSGYAIRGRDSPYPPRVRVFMGTSGQGYVGQLRVLCRNSANSTLFLRQTVNRYDDNIPHLLFFSYNSATGDHVMRIDGVEDIDPGFGQVNTGTLMGATNLEASVGGIRLTSDDRWIGNIGYAGHRPAYLTNYQDFGTGVSPKEIDIVGWTEWGAQPATWDDVGWYGAAQDGYLGAYNSVGSFTSEPIPGGANIAAVDGVAT